MLLDFSKHLFRTMINDGTKNTELQYFQS